MWATLFPRGANAEDPGEHRRSECHAEVGEVQLVLLGAFGRGNQEVPAVLFTADKEKSA